MDPFTAALILTTITTAYLQYDASQRAQNAQDDAAAIQEYERRQQVKREIGVAQQRTNTALAGAASRRTSPTQPSYSGSVLGGLPSVNTSTYTPKNAGSSGTF